MRLLPLAALFLSAFATNVAADAEYTAGSLRDPFTEVIEVAPASARPTVSADMIGKNLTVEGISYSEQNPKAIVNGKILGVGDEVGRVGRITRIERDGIAIQAGGQEFFFKQTIGKQNAPTQNA